MKHRRRPSVLTPVRREVVSPADYKRLISTGDTTLIARSRFVPPRPGQRSFGSFEIEYVVPVLRPAEKEAA